MCRYGPDPLGQSSPAVPNGCELEPYRKGSLVPSLWTHLEGPLLVTLHQRHTVGLKTSPLTDMSGLDSCYSQSLWIALHGFAGLTFSFMHLPEGQSTAPGCCAHLAFATTCSSPHSWLTLGNFVRCSEITRLSVTAMPVNPTRSFAGNYPSLFLSPLGRT